jgi:DNA-binding beta-propeller fold protein YncE
MASGMRRVSPAVLALLAGMAGATGAARAQGFYRLESTVTFKSASPAWDYLTFDPARSWLFIDRRADGVTVYDTVAGKVVGQIERSNGANATTLVAEADRGYTTNGDGSTTIFRLSTLETLDRVKLGKSADAAFYEPVTGQLAFMMGDEHEVTFVDARTGAITGRLKTPGESLEAAAADGEGRMYIAERDRAAVLRVDVRRRTVLGEWKIPGCEQPTGLAIDRPDHRLFVGCRGARPVLAVLATDTGRLVATLPIGRGNDGVVYDRETRRVFTSNGLAANLVIFDQGDSDRYVLSQAVTTRPIARTMALDPKTKRVFLVTAEGVVDPARPINREAGPFYPNRYFADTFTLLTYAPR